MGDGPISGGIDRQMVGQTNQPTDGLTKTDRDAVKWPRAGT